MKYRKRTSLSQILEWRIAGDARLNESKRMGLGFSNVEGPLERTIGNFGSSAKGPGRQVGRALVSGDFGLFCSPCQNKRD